ncbi:alpha/beta hydrolase [Gordonia defluvii]
MSVVDVRCREPGVGHAGEMRRVVTSESLWWSASLAVFLLAAAVFVLHVTPTPGALLTRRVFDDGASARRARNAQFADPNVWIRRDISYLRTGSPLVGAAARDTLFDIYRANSADGPAPTIVWIHGGGWVSGDKADPAHYLSRLAGAGFTVVSLNYSLAPQRHYPLAIRQLNEAMSHPSGMATRILGWGVNNTLWAYSGSRAVPSPALDQMSTIRHLTPGFPPTWIGAGNADPLTATQSIPLAAALREQGVAVSTLIFDTSTPEQVGHEFQFELGTPAGQRALASSIEFAHRVTR